MKKIRSLCLSIIGILFFFIFSYNINNNERGLNNVRSAKTIMTIKEPLKIFSDDRTKKGISENIQIYEVKKGDSVNKIAKIFNIKNNTIFNLNGRDLRLIPKQKILVSNVNGLLYTVKEGDTIDTISDLFKVDKNEIINNNNFILTKKTKKIQLIKGDQLIIPNGNIFPEKGKELLTPYLYKLKAHGKNNPYPKGQCTWFVAEYKDVKWDGNAKDWYYNAQRYGRKVGKDPKEGSIIVFNGSGYDKDFGHVAIVLGVYTKTLIIAEMNFYGNGTVSYREINKNANNILGYIYD